MKGKPCRSMIYTRVIRISLVESRIRSTPDSRDTAHALWQNKKTLALQVAYLWPAYQLT